MAGSHLFDKCCAWFGLPAAASAPLSPASQEIHEQPSASAQPPQQVCAPPAPPILDSGRDVGEHFSDARHDDCSGMPPANNRARTDLLSGVSSTLLAASLPRPQLPQEGQSLDSRDAELGDMAPTGSAREPLGLCPTMDNLLSSGDVNRLPPESCAQGGPDVLEISDRALGSAQSTIASAPVDHAHGMHANKEQVSESGDAEGLLQQSSTQGSPPVSKDAEHESKPAQSVHSEPLYPPCTRLFDATHIPTEGMRVGLSPSWALKTTPEKAYRGGPETSACALTEPVQPEPQLV